MANNFEAAAFALQCAFPKNKILMDDKGMPSVFVWIPAFRLCDVLSTTSTDIHPAFRVNGKEIAGFYFGKYQTKVYNERAYSLPAEDPTVSQNFDWFASKTKANGTGWHEATVAEWAAVALWCHKRGCEPRGNNNYGKDANESTYDAIPAPGVQDSGKTARVLTGTGPLPWSHNGQMDGIWDMNGNVWEWLLGLRLYQGGLANNTSFGRTANHCRQQRRRQLRVHGCFQRSMESDPCQRRRTDYPGRQRYDLRLHQAERRVWQGCVGHHHHRPERRGARLLVQGHYCRFCCGRRCKAGAHGTGADAGCRSYWHWH